MKPLIRGQKIRIDSHRRGDGRPADMPFVHLHKSTKFPIEGRLRSVDIEIPLEEHGSPRYSIGDNWTDEIPRPLLRELQDVLSDKRRAIDFANEVVRALENYNPNDAEEVSSEALRRIARNLGLKWTEKQIHKITGHYGGTAVQLQLRDDIDQHVYSFMINPTGLQMEDTMRETFGDINEKKYIIVNRGRSNRGKSESIKMVAELLRAKNYPCEWLYGDDEDGEEDVTIIFQIGNSLVGVESQGDPGYWMEESIDRFEAKGCDIILTAARPVGDTYDKVFDMNKWYGYEILLDMNPRPYYNHNYSSLNKAQLFDMNRIYAEQTVKLIEYLARK